MKFKKLEESEKEVILHPYIVVRDDYFDVRIKDSNGDEQILLSVFNDGMFETYKLCKVPAEKWGIKVDDSGGIRRRFSLCI